jgi:hypothetical protein
MLKRGLLSLVLVLLISGCGFVRDKPVVAGIEQLNLQVTEGAPYIFGIENPKGRFKSNTFSNLRLELGNNDYARLNFAEFTPNSISDNEVATATMHLTGLKLGKTNLNFMIFYDEGGATKTVSFKLPTKVIGPGINIEIEEKPVFGKTKLRVNQTKIFHAVITNSKDIRYRNGRLKIQPLYDWVKLKELEGYDAYMDGSTLIITTDLPTAKTIPFMVNAVPPAIEAGFSVDVIVEYSSNATEWAGVAKKTIDMFAEG